jgi:hypothetical protein
MHVMAFAVQSEFRRLTALALTVVFLAAVAAPAVAAESPADWMYSPRTISEIDLTLPPSSWKTLEEHPEDEYVPGTFAIAETDGAPGTAGPFTTPIEVGVRLKGGALGSLRTLDQKAAFKIKFGAFVEDQTFLGLEKMTLNNMVEDPSMVHEAAAYQAFQALGVPSPHVGFAYLRVNGESFGLHLNIETQDKIALEKQLGPFLSPPQHLYEGEYGADVTPARVERFEVDEGKKKEKGDLEALVAAVSSSSPSFSAAVGPLADLGEMTRMWATEKYIGHWDGYSGRATEYQPNNFYLYSDANGRFQMLPSGTDETWAEHLGFEDTGGALFSDCVADAECKATYRQGLATALSTLNGLDLDDSVRCAAERLQPWQQLEAAEESPAYPERVPFSLAQIAGAVGSTRDFIADRPGELATFLGVPNPTPPPSQPCPSATQRRDHEAPPAPGGSTASGSASAPLGLIAPARLIRSWVGGRAVRLRVTVSGAGELVLYGWIGAGKRHANACVPVRRRVSTSGSTGITCKLTDLALRRRANHRVRLHLKVDFLPFTGAPQEIRSDLVLPKHQG